VLVFAGLALVVTFFLKDLPMASAQQPTQQPEVAVEAEEEPEGELLSA
jgi:hypothetical protein